MSKEARSFPVKSFIRRREPKGDRAATATEGVNNARTNYTLQYSHSFRRHLVREGGRVVGRFIRLDEALQTFPGATLLSAASRDSFHDNGFETFLP
jgi:hypothetical protein